MNYLYGKIGKLKLQWKVEIIFIFILLIHCNNQNFTGKEQMQNDKEFISENLINQPFYIKGKYNDLIDYVYKGDTVDLKEEEWKKLLNEWQFYILREKGTERAFTGKYYQNKEKGIYVCSACGMPLFLSETKYESGSGWPSFYAPIKKEGEPLRIREELDTSYGMIRTEIMCNRCKSHLGHVFPDGPKPTGLRYCVNSASIHFIPEKEH